MDCMEVLLGFNHHILAEIKLESVPDLVNPSII